MKSAFKRALSLILVLLFSIAAGFAEGLTDEPLFAADGAVSGGVEPEPEPEGEFMLGDPDGAPALGSDEAPIAGSDSDADGAIEANAAADENSEKIIYFDPSKNLGQSVPDGYALLTAESRAWSSGQWYVARESVVIGDGPVVVGEDVNLLLCDDATVKVPYGIIVNKGCKLTVWGQGRNSNMGVLCAGDGEHNAAGVGGGDGENCDCGAIHVKGGKIIATGGPGGAGIGGGRGGAGGDVTLTGGWIVSEGKDGGAAIGEGDGGADPGILNFDPTLMLDDGPETNPRTIAYFNYFHSIKLSSLQYGKIIALVDNKKATKVLPGTKVTLIAEPYPGAQLAHDSLEINHGDVGVKKLSEYVYYFSMPNFNVSVYAHFTFGIADVPSNYIFATMESAGSDALLISWTKARSADGYDVFYKECRGGGGDAVASVEGGDALDCTLTNLRPGTCYQAYVRPWKLIDGEKNYGNQTCPTVHAYTDGGAKRIVNPTGLTLKQDALTVRLGKTARVRAEVKGEARGRRMAYHVPKLRYISGNPDVATVSSAGKVKAVGSGECSVYVMTTNGIWDEVAVTVDASPTRAAFAIGKNKLYEGDALDLSKRLKLTPKGADTTLKWTSSKPEVASVNEDGLVTALTPGKTAITVETDNGKKAKLTLTVKPRR